VRPSDATQRELERIVKARERLKFQVYAAVRDVALRTELFRSHPQLHEPEISVHVYPQLVDVYTSLTEGQLRLLRVSGPRRDLTQFALELRRGIEVSARNLGLTFTEEPHRLGGSQPVGLLDSACGYRAVLIRSEPE
jgi:hypothetical protein